jgi:hypothetical protein
MDIKFRDFAVKYARILNFLCNKNPHKDIYKAKFRKKSYTINHQILKYIKVFGCGAYHKDFSNDKNEIKT